MSYTPTEWVTGDIITAEKLNNIEQGIIRDSGGGDTVVAPEQTATTVLGEHDAELTLTLNPEYPINDNLEIDVPINWDVMANGNKLSFTYYEIPDIPIGDSCYYYLPSATEGAIAYGVAEAVDDDNYILRFVTFKYNSTSQEWQPASTTATVSITEPASGPVYPGGVGSDYIIAAPKQTVTTSYNEGSLEYDAIITFADGYSYDTSLGIPLNWCIFVNGCSVPFDVNSLSYVGKTNDETIQFMIQGGYLDDPVVLIISTDDGQGDWVNIEATATVTILQPASGPVQEGPK